MNITALYFSGTGNTAYVVQSIRARLADSGISMPVVNIENFNPGQDDCLRKADTLLFAYPVYGSMAPRIMREFVANNAALFKGKNAVIIATQLLFSGDGSAFLARMLRTCNMRILAMEHINMPSNLSDVNVFKIRNGAENASKIAKAEKRIDRFCESLLSGHPVRRGRLFPSRLLGLTQRLAFRGMEPRLAREIKINPQRCTVCEHCVAACPMHNLYREGDGIRHRNNCTLCYRCINLCPAKAISLMTGKPPKVQYAGVGQPILSGDGR